MARSYIGRMRIAFGDCDPAQIVFYANYFKWFDTSTREFFAACEMPSWPFLERYGIIGAPLVDAGAKFLNSATYGEGIEIETSVSEWKTRSFILKHVARRGATELAIGHEVRVFVSTDPENPSRLKGIPIPDEIRARCG